MKLLYEGKAKKIWDDGVLFHGQPTVIMEFKDSLTAFNAQKRGQFEAKGKLNLKISQALFDHLKSQGISHHVVEVLDDSRIRVQKLEMLPVEVVVRNRVAGSLAKRLGLREGELLRKPLVEFYLKNDELQDPLLSEGQIEALEILTPKDLAAAQDLARRINQELLGFFKKIEIDLIDFKIELGKNSRGELLLADEVTPDSCRLWDQKTQEKLDKDVFRRDLGDVEEAYRKVAQRMGIL
jgi:phosphoribosylaminoimidazole-succinocarboxamide synthase